MKNTILIRPAEAEDAEAILKYLNQAGGETDNLLFGKEGVPYTVEQEMELIREMKSSPISQMFIAVSSDQVAGIASIRGFRPKRIAHRSEIGLSVLRKFWGQGIGSALLTEMISFARSSDVEIISLEVRSDNERAIRLYEKFGFEKFGTYHKFFKINGQYHDAEYMNLYLKK